jgi:hypothetical protein
MVGCVTETAHRNDSAYAAVSSMAAQVQQHKTTNMGKKIMKAHIT